MRRAALMSALAALALFAGSAPAADPVDQAKIYYDAGVQAYTAARYDVAVQAFTEAYRLAPKATVLFSLAQAERRQYIAGRDDKLLRDAIEHYRRYLELVPEGGRRADVIDALSELELLAARSEKPAGGAAPEDAASEQTARLLLSTATTGASITLDGVEHKGSPVLAQVKPGSHTVRVSAPGCFDEELTVRAVEGVVVPYEITLKERPSFLALAAPAGAAVSVDGEPVGEAPLGALVMAPGTRSLVVTQRGYVPRVLPVTFERGKTTPVEVKLERTTQRLIAFGGFATAGVAALTGVVLAIGAADEERLGRRILSRSQERNISQAELDQYNEAIELRDYLRVSSLITFGVAGALGLAAAGVYYFDNASPSVDGLKQSRRAQVSMWVGPTGAGVGLQGTF